MGFSELWLQNFNSSRALVSQPRSEIERRREKNDGKWNSGNYDKKSWYQIQYTNFWGLKKTLLKLNALWSAYHLKCMEFAEVSRHSICLHLAHASTSTLSQPRWRLLFQPPFRHIKNCSSEPGTNRMWLSNWSCNSSFSQRSLRRSCEAAKNIEHLVI